MEHFAGAELRKKVTQLGLLRKGKPPSQYLFSNDRHTVEKVLGRLTSGNKIVVEATSTWWWFVEKSRELGHEVYLSHPKQTKAIASARLKSDKVNALMLARLLKTDLLQEEEGEGVRLNRPGFHGQLRLGTTFRIVN